MAVVTINPNTSYSGDTGSTNTTSWAACRAENPSDFAEAAGSDSVDRLHAQKSGSTFTLERLNMVFDTSTIPAAATITAANLVLKSSAQTITDTYRLVPVEDTRSTKNAALTTSDYQSYGTTELASRITVTGASQTFTFALNASGLALINAGGWTSFGVRSNMDLDNSAPTGVNIIRPTWSGGNSYLEVTYTSGSPKIIFF